MNQDAAEEFARDLMRRVRDEAIDACDILVSEEQSRTHGAPWSRALGPDSAGERELFRTLIPEVVDIVLFHLLNAIDNDDLELSLTVGGTSLRLSQIGEREMAGWLACGRGGWVDRFSERRFYDSYGKVFYERPEG